MAPLSAPDTSGFTLLELAFVVTAGALLATAGISTTQSMLEDARRVQTLNKLDLIEQALKAYREINNQLPCPASLTLPKTDANYAKQAAGPGSCTGGTPAANFSGSGIVEGAVPTFDLNLPASFLYDGWGRRFVYAVNQTATDANAFATSVGPADACGITVKDAAAGNRTTGAIYALLSVGPNGHGGYLESGVQRNAGSTNADELTNVHVSAGITQLASYVPTYVMKNYTGVESGNNKFDDLVRYKTRWQLINGEDASFGASTSTMPDMIAGSWDSVAGNPEILSYRLACGMWTKIATADVITPPSKGGLQS